MSPTRPTPHTGARVLLLLVVATLAVLSVPGPASAAVSVSRAEFADGRLRIEGRALANRSITVDGVVMATSDGSGSFKISRSPYTPPADCTVDVNDGSATATTSRLSGCTVSSAPPPAPAAAILPDAPTLGPAYVGARFQDTAVQNLVSFGPDAVGPVSWQITSGALPAGLEIRIPVPAGRPPLVEPTYMYLEGTPTTVQTSTFTLRATDANGLTASRTYTIEVQPPRPLAITAQAWPPLRVGEGANLWFDGSGGVQPYQWTVSAGQPPPGMTLVDDTTGDGLVRIGGTPTTSGTFSWTLQLADAAGAQLEREFSVTVGAASALSSLTITPTTVTAGSSATGTVTLDQPAPAAGAEVLLTSSNPQAASVNTRVFVIAAGTTASFPISTAAVSAPTTVTVTASYSGSTRSATLTVEPGSAPAPTEPLTAPSLLSPANDARWEPGVSRTFDWSDVPGAATYVVQVSTSSAFSTIQLERVVTASQVALSFSTEGTRYWRVRAAGNDGTPGPWSATRSFRIRR